MAQGGQGAIRLKATEFSNQQPIPFANIVVKQDGKMITGASTDFDGIAIIHPVNPGVYDLEITSLGFSPLKVREVQVIAGKATYLSDSTCRMHASAVQLEEFLVIEYKKPLIEHDGAATQETFLHLDRIPHTVQSGRYLPDKCNTIQCNRLPVLEK